MPPIKGDSGQGKEEDRRGKKDLGEGVTRKDAFSGGEKEEAKGSPASRMLHLLKRGKRRGNVRYRD